uniref:WD repeat domain 90 n=1 Tax=Astyanax mexicanus TaxID=7994 RepID=A0A8B9LBR8_ASTMX
MSSKAWQHPYVNVFKHLKLEEWRKASKEGDVTTYMDKTLKCSVFRIRGSIPASNYILLPRTSSQSLGLTGRYLYLLFRPSPSKHFVVHVDIASEEGQVIRVSFSNLFKEFKSTATWLQFPFLCGAASGSVYETTAKSAKHGLVGPAPASVRWTCLMMDMRYVLSVYLNKTHSHLKSIKLCSNMTVKNLMTSDLLLDPGLSFSEFRQAGVMLPEGTAPMPREMCFPVPKGSSWHQLYDYIRFPTDGVKMPFDSIQKGLTNQTPKETVLIESPIREESRSVNLSKPVQDRVSLIQQITTPKPRAEQRPLLLTSSLPELPAACSERVDSLRSPSQRSQAPEGDRVVCDDGGGVHVYAHYEEDDHSSHSSDSEDVAVVNAAVPRPLSLRSIRPAKQQRKLQPDPILKLSRIIGFGGATLKCAVWANDGEEVVYPCHAIIVSMKISSGQQRFFIGHTDKVSALALNTVSSLLASAQTGTHCLIRLWSYSKGQCLTMIKTHAHSLNTLSFSYSGGVLCGVGKDSHNKTMVVVWNTQRATKGGVVTIMAKAHTDVDVQTMKIAFFDDTRMVSCGVGNVRLWRVRGGSLRSCPVNLGQYHSLEFTDLAFEEGHAPDRQPDDRTLFASSKSGHILEIDYISVAIKNVRRLLPSQQNHSHRREKQTFSTGPGIAVNSISVCGAFCATGSEDGFLRLWPLDFSSVLLEAEHEGPVSLVSVSADGMSVLAATSTGNLGYLDVNSRGYRTLMRSHTNTVLGFSVDGIRRQITTASKDCTVRVWAMDSMQQLYDFVSDEDNDAPCSVVFHPSLPVFACGSNSGTVRVFDIPESSLLAQHRQHRGAVVGLVFSPDGEHLYSAGSLGYLALYNAFQPEYPILRVLGNVVAQGADRGPDALVVSSDSRCLAFVGPTEYTVTIMDAHTLDELLRVDVSVLDVESTTLDSALKVCFAPSSLSHLLITTSSNKILWINRSTGRLLREVSEVHKHQCASLAVSEDGCFLLTAGHNAVKVWDYNMKLDVNSQVFIGHSQPITQVSFTPDQMGVVSVGDAIFFWDFLAQPHQEPSCSLSSVAAVTSPPRASKGLDVSLLNAVLAEQEKTEFNEMLSNGMPRKEAPRPSSSLPVLDVSSIQKTRHGASFLSLGGCDDDEDDDEEEELQSGPSHSPAPRHASFLRVTERAGTGDSLSVLPNHIRAEENHEDLKMPRPDCYKHFTPRYKTSVQDTSAVTPPPGQEGLSLKAVIGYNGNGRSNMVWNPDTGLFVYSCGCVVVVENLHTGSQKHWHGHSEEISTLAVTHDAQMVASASGGGASSKSLICIWNVQDGSRRNSISYHKGSVQRLAFSRDDLYFLSVGDFQESVVALWSTRSFELLCAVSVSVPLHEAAFCPSSASQLAFTGSSTVFFCTIHTHGRGAELQVQKVAVPERIGEAEVTSLCYNTNSILYTGTNRGLVCVWDTNTLRCFLTWEADEGEIGMLVCRGNRLVTGSNSKKLRLWSVGAVQNARPSNSERTTHQNRNSQVLLEQEMLLDGTVVSAAFDDVMDMGIVGTTAGTLWYINWVDNTSIRLISGHKSKVNGVVCSPDERHFATCGQDGSVRVWALPSNELLVQFQVLNQSCECVCWSRPLQPCESGGTGGGVCVAGGYSDGSVRVFNVESAEMELKLLPHCSAVCALQYSHHGQVLLSGGKDGVVTVSSPFTGVTSRIINDHKGAPITTIQCIYKQYREFGLEGNELWLAVSLDRRVSIWAADWAKDKCELLDWLTFPAPSSPEEAANLPPSLAAFSPTERGVVVYTGYSTEREMTFYCLKKKQELRTVSLTDWALSLSLCFKERLLAVGSNKRVLKLIDSSSGRFQGFTWHSDSVHLCSFSPSGTQLFTTAHNEVFLWTLRGL